MVEPFQRGYSLVQRHPDYTRTRIKQLTERFFHRIYSEKKPVVRLEMAGPVDRIPQSEAKSLKYKPAKMGVQLEPEWKTFWFNVDVQVPKEWAGSRVDFLWVTGGEATIWIDNYSEQGINWVDGNRPDVVLFKKAAGGDKISFQVEAACSGKFGQRHRPNKYISAYVLQRCEIGKFDPIAWELYYDLKILAELESNLNTESGSSEKAWSGHLLGELNRFANTLVEEDRSTWKKAQQILKDLYKNKNATYTHELSAIGHAHIDTAWLWPLAETHRKCERSFASAVKYMEDYPEYKFACSQAYQYEAIRLRNPELFARIKKRVKTGQWVPVGGTWIEPDCNIPSGEALARQFVYGQQYFMQHFGFRCKEFWNPDVFGYNGQLPQIMKLAGINRFLTQKLSWNAFNKPHTHTFLWQAIDGSEVLAHFPPADTYNCNVEVHELRFNARNYKDNDRSNESLTLFGYGDGGGGPTKQMLEQLRRFTDLQGLPRTQIRSSDEFFDRLEKDLVDPLKIVGELYFEFHRGTYTTQANNKRDNRKSEQMLHDVEFLSLAAGRLGKLKYPKAELERIWRLVLLNQFHDILPGSSIREVYEDSAMQYADVLASGQNLRQEALDILTSKTLAKSPEAITPINTTSFARREVVTGPDKKLQLVEAPAYGLGQTISPTEDDVVTATESRKQVVLENTRLKATLSTDGKLLSLIHKATGRESIAGLGNVFKLYNDQPTTYEAWDIDPWTLETGEPCVDAESCVVKAKNPLRAEVIFKRKLGAKSTMTQTVRLDAGSSRLEFWSDVDWQENQKLLKVAFDLAPLSPMATYEMQFGSCERPTHYNNNYDLAKYEVPAHRWADLSEHGFGVALLNESKYGYHTLGSSMHLSLLRSSKSPDPKADMGKHHFGYALYPHAGQWHEGGVVAEGYTFNYPLLLAPGSADAPRSLFSVDHSGLVLDTIKQSEDGSDIVIRLYESLGGSGVANITTELDFDSAVYCNLLEDEEKPARIVKGKIQIPFGPYKIISLKLKQKSGKAKRK